MRRISPDELVARIANSDTPKEAFEIFMLHRDAPALKKAKFVFASETGASLGFAASRAFSAKSVVRSLFNTEKVLVLDQKSVEAMFLGNEFTFPVDYSISLDTMALSYLAPYINGGCKRLPDDFKEIFEFIARPDVNVDAQIYMQENLHNLADPDNVEKILTRLKGYEVLRTLDVRWLQQHNEIRSTVSPEKIEARAKKLLAGMKNDLKNKAYMGEINHRFTVLYCQLLKMAVIQLSNPGAPLQEKLEQFFEFQHETLARINAREIAVARAFFERGDKLGFFRKVQKKRDGLFKELENMTWDLFHIRHLELSMTIKPLKGARYFFPALLTCDKKFIEIIDLYPLRSCSFIEGTARPIPVYAGDFFGLVADTIEGQEAFGNRYYSPSVIADRDLRRKAVKAKIGSIKQSLENTLGEVSGVIKSTEKAGGENRLDA